MSLLVGDTILLEGGREPNSLIYGYQGARIISNNMKQLRKQPKEFIIHAQNDTATHNNVKNIRNILIEGIKEDLGMKSSDCRYKNDHGVIFDFRDFKFILSQESMHEYHRQNNINAFKRGHPDSGLMQKDLKAIIRNTRLRYDPIRSPFILHTANNDHKAYYLPYEIYKKEECSFLFCDRFFDVVSRAIRALLMLKRTKKRRLKSQLYRFWRKKYTKNLGRNKIRQALRYICEHTPPYLICAVLSVNIYIYIFFNQIFIYIYMYIKGILGWKTSLV